HPTPQMQECGIHTCRVDGVRIDGRTGTSGTAAPTRRTTHAQTSRVPRPDIRRAEIVLDLAHRLTRTTTACGRDWRPARTRTCGTRTAGTQPPARLAHISRTLIKKADFRSSGTSS